MGFSWWAAPVSSRRSSVCPMSEEAFHPIPRTRRAPGASIPDSRANRVVAGVLISLLLSAVALPVRRLARPGPPDEERDSFPFSHYPMFSARRKRHHWVTHLLGVRADGTVAPLHYSYLGTGGLNAVRRQVRRRVREGDGALLADRAAELIATRNRVADRDVIRVHIVRGRYLVESFMRGHHREVFTSKLDVRGTADVPGRAGRRERPSSAKAAEEGTR